MKFEIELAFRYLRSRRRYRFVSAIPLLSGMGIAAGVMAMLIILAVMDGFEDDLKKKLLGNMAAITITGNHLNLDQMAEFREKLANVNEIQGISPYVKTQVLLVSSDRPIGVKLIGIDYNTISKVSRLAEQIIEGRMDALQSPLSIDGNLPQECKGKPAILLGSELIKNLGSFIGDVVQIVSPFGIETPFGFLPAKRNYCLRGSFQTDMYEYDASLAYVAIEEAQDFLQMGREISGVEVGLLNYYNAPKVADKIKTIFGEGLIIKDWIQQNRRLFSAMRLEKITAFIVLALIVLVAVLNILSSLTMAVIEKKKEIAILKALGFTQGRIQLLFVLQGMLIGLSGTLIGIFAGIAVCKVLAAYPVLTLPQDVFYQLTLPVQLHVVDIVSISVAALLLSLLATLYPAWKAAHMSPAETLRYE